MLEGLKVAKCQSDCVKYYVQRGVFKRSQRSALRLAVIEMTFDATKLEILKLICLVVDGDYCRYRRTIVNTQQSKCFSLGLIDLTGPVVDNAA